MTTAELPSGLERVRVTPGFTETTVPAGLLGSHRVAAGVWGLLVVGSGSLRFVFDGQDEPGVVVSAGMSQVIPPEAEHHVEVIGPVEFVVEFHRPRVPSGDVGTVIA